MTSPTVVAATGTVHSTPERKIVKPSVDVPTRVLIAEDHEPARTALKSLLEWKGFEVIATADGKDALEVLTSDGAPSIALLDWEMPGMTGIGV